MTEATRRTCLDALTEWDNAMIMMASKRGRPPGCFDDDQRLWPRFYWPGTVHRIDEARAELIREIVRDVAAKAKRPSVFARLVSWWRR